LSSLGSGRPQRVLCVIIQFRASEDYRRWRTPDPLLQNSSYCPDPCLKRFTAIAIQLFAHRSNAQIPRWMGSALSALSQSDCPPCAHPPQNDVLVEVWRGGDDGLTRRLTDTAERAFKSSSRFVSSYGKKPGTLVVTIPTNVRWEKKSGRLKVIYKVTFDSADDKRLGARSGSCWETSLEKCAGQIVSEATRSASRMHP